MAVTVYTSDEAANEENTNKPTFEINDDNEKPVVQ